MSSPDHAGEDPVAVSDVSVTSIESSADHANGRPVFSADSASSPSVGGPSDEVFSPSTSSSSTSSSRGDDRSAGASSSSHPFLARQRDHLAEIRLLSHSSPEKSSGSSSLRVHEDADDSRHDYPEPPSPLHSLGRPRPPYLAKVIGSNAEADPAPLFDLEFAGRALYAQPNTKLYEIETRRARVGNLRAASPRDNGLAADAADSEGVRGHEGGRRTRWSTCLVFPHELQHDSDNEDLLSSTSMVVLSSTRRTQSSVVFISLPSRP